MLQMQPMMAPYYPNNVTTNHIQQYLDENKSLILKIVESQNSGKLNESAENQARLQRNLMYLAAIADSQPQPNTLHSQYAPSGMMQSGARCLQQQQQAQRMSSQATMAASSCMLYGQQAYQTLQQSQALHAGQMAMLQGEPHCSSSSGMLGGYPDFGRVKQDIGNSNGRGGCSSDGGEALYLKFGDDGN